MKYSKKIIVLAFLFISVSAWSQRRDTTTLDPAGPTENPFDVSGEDSRGFYGEDDRRDASEAVGFEQFVQATAAMVKRSKVKDGYIKTGTLRDWLGQAYEVTEFGSNVSFLDEPTCASCTGFLIAPDMLVTAGHCIKTFSDCEDEVWLFDYTTELTYNSSSDKLYVDNSNIIECDDILTRSLVDGGGDWAVIRLKTPVDREPYRFRLNGKIANNQDIFMIGSPSGLPLKLADNAKVRFNNEAYSFEANLDAFGGNSGGPVFDVAGWIEGILVRGSSDYEYNSTYNAVMVSQHDNNAYYGEDVQRITSLPREILLEAVYNNIEYAIRKNDMNRLQKWLAYTGITEDPYVVNRGRFENIAMEENNLDALKLILQNRGADASMLQYTIVNGHTEYLEELLKGGANPSKRDGRGETPIFWAIEKGNHEALVLLLRYGSRVDVAENENSETALHLAVRKNDIDAVAYLLRSGANLTLENNQGLTACKLSKKLKYKAITKLIKTAERGKLYYYNQGWN